MNNVKILHYDTFDVSEGIDSNKTIASKECDICHYLYFLNKGFKFQPYICNRCNDLLRISVKIKNQKLKLWRYIQKWKKQL